MIAALALLLAGQGAATVPLGPAAFRDRVEAAVTAQTHWPVAALDERRFTATRADGSELTVSIDEVYARYLRNPAAVDALIERFVPAALGPEGEATVDQLVVILRPADYLQRSLPADVPRTDVLASRPMAGDLAWYLAVDAPRTIRLASPADLARWHLDEAAAWARAVANVKGRVGPLEQTRLGDEDGADGLGAKSGLAPSVLADPAMCGPAAPEGAGGQLVLLYARDLYLYALPADAAHFWTRARAEIAAGRSLSHTVVTCRAGRWVTATPPR